jgi:hypothetical protein
LFKNYKKNEDEDSNRLKFHKTPNYKISAINGSLNRFAVLSSKNSSKFQNMLALQLAVENTMLIKKVIIPDDCNNDHSRKRLPTIKRVQLNSKLINKI